MCNMAFWDGPRPGEPTPGFDLPTPNDGRVRKHDFVGRRPLLLTCTSIACPMAATMGPDLRWVRADFGDRIDFVTLYGHALTGAEDPHRAACFRLDRHNEPKRVACGLRPKEAAG